MNGIANKNGGNDPALPCQAFFLTSALIPTADLTSNLFLLVILVNKNSTSYRTLDWLLWGKSVVKSLRPTRCPLMLAKGSPNHLHLLKNQIARGPDGPLQGSSVHSPASPSQTESLFLPTDISNKALRSPHSPTSNMPLFINSRLRLLLPGVLIHGVITELYFAFIVNSTKKKVCTVCFWISFGSSPRENFPPINESQTDHGSFQEYECGEETRLILIKCKFKMR